MTSPTPEAQDSSFISSSKLTPSVSNLPSCLGNVSLFFEPLKVCLDDDSSFDEDDEYDDDDFFIEDYELVHAMEICQQNKSQEHTSTCSLLQLKSTLDENDNKIQVDPPTVSADNTTTTSFQEATSNNSSLSSRLCSSTGNLTSVSNDSSLDSKSSPRSKRKVSLRNDVAVLPIPKREEYSDRIKERLWSSASELYLNAARNSIEFAAEGFNWRNATEDENMIVCDSSGELIHPIHLHHFVTNCTSSLINVPK